MLSCFKKVRVVEKGQKTDVNIENSINELNNLKQQHKSLNVEQKHQVENRIQELEVSIAESISENFKDNLVSTLENIGGDTQNINGSGRNQLWKMLKQANPKSAQSPPVAKKDVSGNMITSHDSLKDLYFQTYKQRLRNRPIREGFEEIKTLKEELFDLRMNIAKSAKSPPWTMDDLNWTLSHLKSGKARDPNGWCNELFKEGVAGHQLKLSMLVMFNRIKSENYIPDFIRKADVATIYKGKGEKCNLENERGIFLVTTFRTILMKLLYKENYEKIDRHMSDSQIGARKSKNVRNHIWIVNGIICDVLSTKKKSAIDILIYDYKQCFDSLWLQECLNDIYESGLQDDNLSLLYDINRKVNISVKTPVGKTTYGWIENVITQGDVFSPILCSNQVDKIGKECLDEKKYIYLYKGEVEIPPLAMVDDVLNISECGHKTAMASSYINFKTDVKKLQFGVKKCAKMHVGQAQDYKCSILKVGGWKEVAVRDDKSGEISISDITDGEHEMESKEQEKYLGDYISIDGRNIFNIKARVAKGQGIVNQILTIMQSLPIGRRYFEVGLILRDSLLVSSLLFNTEAWYNITNAEICLLESIDNQFLRRLLNAEKGTPKEILYLELGCLPLKDIIRQRRLGFYHYILNENPESLIHKFLKSQSKNRTKKDWMKSIEEDMKYLEIETWNEEKIKSFSKQKFMNIIKEINKQKTFQYLINKKETHSKVKELKYDELKIQDYLSPNRWISSKDEAQFIFKLRCNQVTVKANLKWKYEDVKCRACYYENETQQHIYDCQYLKETNVETKVETKVEYEKLLNGSIAQKIEISKLLKIKIEKIEEIERLE